MKKIHRVLALLMAALMAFGLMTTAFAEPTIDPAKKASLSIYKYDITKASEDGVWDAESYGAGLYRPVCHQGQNLDFPAGEDQKYRQ